jgi:branched-chain amino acid aminotransferase
MPTMFNINGRICTEQDATVSVLDHGFLYGEGVYEVCRTYDGQPFLFDRHVRRLRQSADLITLPVPFSDEELVARVTDTLEAADLDGHGAPAAYVRILLTRGTGELNYDPASCSQPTLVIIVKRHVAPSRDVYELGVRVALVPVVRNHPASLNPLIKSNNLLNNALAMQHALRHGAFEAVMRNHAGELAECSQSNLFIVKADAVLTPPLEAGLLAGITREYVFEIGCALGLHVAEAPLHDEDLFQADEAFLTSTTREIVPIVLVDDRRIGSGHPGSTTRALLDAYRVRTLPLPRGDRGTQTPAFSA